jgi:hypothetical protein
MTEQPIAERVLHAAEDPTITIHVRIYAPLFIPDGRDHLNDWKVTVDLEGLPPASNFASKPSWVVGASDSLGALLLAIVSVRGALDACYRNLGLQFTWDEVKDIGGHAIPYSLTTYLGPDHERHLMEMMLKEDRAVMDRAIDRAARLRREREDDRE